ncbi:MAG: phosphoribosylanthranilate isomerase [Planctomycetota bacterium]|nr:phosphoribosylanthranilate isomerase [Planctomycetota bacterium]
MQIKICGVCRPEDVATVAAAGADAIGLNFYAKSPRYLLPSRAAEVIAEIPPEMVKVGVFVNATADEVIETFTNYELDAVQLHGDETPRLIAKLGVIPVVRALRLGPGGLAAIEKYIDECRQLDVELAGLLIDSFEAGQFGGTGRVANWDLLKQWEVADDVPLILAGGLTAENVAEAIATVQPVAVDTASGVEISPGIKDPARVKAFIDAARRAFEELE